MISPLVQLIFSVLHISATWPSGVQRMADNYLKNPVRTFVGSLDLNVSTVYYWYHKMPYIRIIYPVLRYREALVASRYTKLRIRREELCSKTFEKIKRPESCLNRLIPATRACSNRRHLRFNDRPSLISCMYNRKFQKELFPTICLCANRYL